MTSDVPSLHDRPTRCQQCSLSHGQPVHRHCEVCEGIVFSEITLCDLNRSVQANDDIFTCHAFQPQLTLYTQNGHRERPPRRRDRVLSQRALALKRQAATKATYKKALAVQRAKQNPDDVVIELRYHAVWNVLHRRSIFAADAGYVEPLKAGLADTHLPSVTFAALLWLAPDHIHVYFESDGEASPEAMVNGFKTITSSILKQHPTIADLLNRDGAMWDEAYFCETVG